MSENKYTEPTPSNLWGPYYVKNAPFFAKLSPIHDYGKLMVVKGTVKNTNGEGLPFANLDVWQANMEGKYDYVEKEGVEEPQSQNYEYRARLITDEHGFYQFETFKPPPYVDEQINKEEKEVVYRTPHIHIFVRSEGYKPLVTQLFFKGEEKNNEDKNYDERCAITLEEKEINHTSFYVGSFDLVLETLPHEEKPVEDKSAQKTAQDDHPKVEKSEEKKGKKEGKKEKKKLEKENKKKEKKEKKLKKKEGKKGKGSKKEKTKKSDKKEKKEKKEKDSKKKEKKEKKDSDKKEKKEKKDSKKKEKKDKDSKKEKKDSDKKDSKKKDKKEKKDSKKKENKDSKKGKDDNKDIKDTDPKVAEKEDKEELVEIFEKDDSSELVEIQTSPNKDKDTTKKAKKDKDSKTKKDKSKKEDSKKEKKDKEAKKSKKDSNKSKKSEKSK